MEELKFKYREYYWEYGKSPFVEDEDGERINSNRGDSAAVNAENGGNGNLGFHGGNCSSNASNRCGVHGCKAKAMALTRFCHMHILSDAKQKLYKACSFSIKRFGFFFCLSLDLKMLLFLDVLSCTVCCLQIVCTCRFYAFASPDEF